MAAHRFASISGFLLLVLNAIDARPTASRSCFKSLFNKLSPRLKTKQIPARNGGQSAPRAVLPDAPTPDLSTLGPARVINIPRDILSSQLGKDGEREGDERLNIAITGAAGRTGRLLARELCSDANVRELRCVTHSKRGEKLLHEGTGEMHKTFIVDIYENPELLEDPIMDADTLVILTSAMPKIKTRSLIRLFLAKLFRRKAVRPQFRYKQTPEQVDWIGQKNQIDMAKKAGVKHVILVSSMGGTDPSNMLNKIGNGNILLWKRKAEKYLIDSGLNYTIIHPGGLTDKPGQFEPINGIDDELLQRQTRSISRKDLVEVISQAIFEPKSIGRAFDVIASEKTRDDEEFDWEDFFEECGHCDYSKPDVDEILATGKTLAARMVNS